ncbi:MAG: ABC-2 family transporter protein [Clostridia bacterium]|nr:ABC-2 family transporter protein [Clostridia bacterium]
MKKYMSFFRMRFQMGLQYRTAAIAGMTTQFAWGLMEIMVFRAFYAADPAAFPMTFEATASYIWLQQAFLAIFAAWLLEPEIFDCIVSGNVAYELCRPVHIYDMWFARSMASRLSRVALRCFPILFVALLLPKPYGISTPSSAAQFAVFLITLVLSFLVSVAFYMWIYVLTFYTISPMGLRIMVASVVEFLSGGGVPLPFFPEKVQRVLEFLPFASMQNVPLRVYSGSMSQMQTQQAVALQLLWLIVLVALGRTMCDRALRRVSVQGG